MSGCLVFKKFTFYTKVWKTTVDLKKKERLGIKNLISLSKH